MRAAVPTSSRVAGYEEVLRIVRGKSEQASDEPARLLQLEGLKEADMKDLLREHLGVETLPKEMLTLIYQKSDGNPFWAMEFIKSMQVWPRPLQ